MKIIAVDPGYDRLGVAVMEKINSSEILHFSCCITTDKKETLPQRIFALGVEFEKILQVHKPERLALETLFFNKNIKTGIGVAEARGALLYLAQKYDCAISEYSPQQIKVATTGYGNSDKKAVISMVKMLIKNVPEKALDDEYDAIATGITCLAHYK
jgi:crossover junction endodeoxyribonuclease RuvC